MSGDQATPEARSSAAGSLARRQWPTAAVLVLLFAAEAGTLTGSPGELRYWQLPLIALVAAIAVIAPLSPVLAASAVSAVLTVGTALTIVLGTAGPPFAGGISFTELAAAAAAAVTVVRESRRRPGTAATVALLITVAAASNLRPVFRVVAGAGSGVEFQAVLVLAVATTTGLYLRQRDRDHARMLSSSVTSARQSERLALARELHDLVAHHVTGILVQVKAARRVVETQPGAAADVLPAIESSGTEAMGAMRRLVRALRDTDLEAGSPTAGPLENPRTSGDLPTDLRRLAERAALPVTVTVRGPGLPPEIAGSVLRIAREALTNVDKHAHRPRSATVEVTTANGRVTVDVRNDGSLTADTTPGHGYGLIGMRERVELLGGQLRVGPTSDGWQVHADLPVHRPSGGGS